jgi:hypothetical protein
MALTADWIWLGARPRAKAISRAWKACMPTAGSTLTLKIDCGFSAAMSSISMPPSEEATTITRSDLRSSTKPR